MDDDLIKAKNILSENNYTIVLCYDENIITSIERGVAPLLKLIENKSVDKSDYKNYSASDKVIGKAAAFLYVILGIKNIYTPLISEGAEKVFVENNINVFYDKKVPAILNRNKTGFCPMESSVKELNSFESEKALSVIKTKGLVLRREIEKNQTI